MKKQTEFGSISDFASKEFKRDKTYQFWLIKKNTDTSYFSDEKGNRQKQNLYPISYPLKMEFMSSWINPETEREESAFVRHVATEKSIYRHLQSDDMDGVLKPISKLKFVNGYVNIHGYETSLLEAIAKDDRNASNPTRNKQIKPIYYMRDDEASFKKVLEKDDLEFEVQAFVRDPKNFRKVVAYARVILDKSEFDKLSVDPNLIIYRMKGLAKQDPIKFRMGLNNPAVLKKHNILEAIEEGYLIKDDSANAIYFKSGDLLNQSPMGINPVNDFVDKTMTDRTGTSESLYNMVLKLLRLDAVEEPKKVMPIEIPKVSDSEFDSLYEKGVAQGLITTAGMWRYWKKDAEGTRKYKGKVGMQEAFSKEPALAVDMRNSIL